MPNLSLNYEDWMAIKLTLLLASTTTALLLFVCVPLVWLLVRKNFVGRRLVLAVVNLPLVLPPTILGFYLLFILSPNSWLGKIWVDLGFDPLPFHFSGLLVGSLLYSLPFCVQPLFSSFQSVGFHDYEMAFTMGAKPWQAFLYIFLPQARHGLFSAALLTFAHTLGEFGVVLMVGGNISGRTQVISTLIYSQMERSDFTKVHYLSVGVLIFSLTTLLLLYSWRHKVSAV